MCFWRLFAIMDVVVVGSCMMDLVSYCKRQPRPGETIRGTRFQIGYGGKGANQCVMAAKLGAKSALVAKVGKDSYGEKIIDNLIANGVFADHVLDTSEAISGVASISVSDDGQNSIVIVAGANLLLSTCDVDNASELISSAKVLVCQLEIPSVTSLAALKLAKKNGVFTIFNPAPAVPDIDDAFYTSCDLLCANETEAEILTGVQVCDIPEAKMAAQALIKKGCEKVVITLGHKGCILMDKSYFSLHLPAVPVSAVDTTGAGDAFIGALAYYRAVMPLLPMVTSMERANEIAARSCLQAGTQCSFPSADQLRKQLFQST